MSCEEAKARVDQTMKEWVAAEYELLLQRGPMMGKVNIVTPEKVKEIEVVNQRYSLAANNCIAAMNAWLPLYDLHHARDPQL